MRECAVLWLLAGVAFAQSGVPRIAREGLVQWPDRRPRLLAPGMIMTIYGENLGPELQCPTPIPQNGPYPLETCGVRVLVGGRAAGLLFSGSKQINFKIPDDAPEEGSAPIQVCVHDTCSESVEVRFSLRKAFLHVVGRAYVHMPVWIEVEQPWGDIRYPYSIFPLNFGAARFEIFHHGELLPASRNLISVRGGGTVSPQDSPRGRLPLHLIYRFDEPGVYSVRFTGRGYKYPPGIEIPTESDWTDIMVEPYSDAQRIAWLETQAVKARTASVGELVGDIIPSLLAKPDERALFVLLPLLDHSEALVRECARSALDLFDEDVQRRVIPANRWNDLHNRMISILG